MTVFRTHCIRLMIHLRAGYVCVTQYQDTAERKAMNGKLS